MIRPMVALLVWISMTGGAIAAPGWDGREFTVLLEGAVDDTVVVSRPLPPQLKAMLRARGVRNVRRWEDVTDEGILRGRYAARYVLGRALRGAAGAALVERRFGRSVRLRIERRPNGALRVVEILDPAPTPAR